VAKSIFLEKKTILFYQLDDSSKGYHDLLIDGINNGNNMTVGLFLFLLIIYN
jgi:hypothetical protein